MKKAIYLCALIVPLLLNNIWASPPAETSNDDNNKPKQELPYSFKHSKKLKAKVVAEIIDPQAVYDGFMKTVNANLFEISHYLGSWERNYKRNLTDSGTWEELPNGDRLWRLKISATGNFITGIGVHASDKMNIPQGGKLFFYSDDKKYVVGPITKPNYEGSKQLLVNTIPGKTIWVEYYEPKAQKGKSTFNIDALLYRFVAFPYGITHKLKQEVPFMNPFKPAYEDLITEELRVAGTKLGEIRGGSTGGIRMPLLDKGVWTELPNGDRIWRMGFESRIAYGMSIIVLMDIPKQCYVSFYSADGQYVSSIYHEPTNANDGNFITGNMPGNKYIIEYYEPKEFRNKGKLKLHSIDTDLTKTVADKGNRSVQPTEVACSPNVSCDCDDFEYRTDTLDAFCGTNLWAMVDTLKRAVVKYQIFLPCSNPEDPGCIPSSDDSTVFVYNALAKYYGSGALINNPQLEPYILSAHHCIKQVGIWGTHVVPHTVGDKVHFRFDFGFETTCNDFLAADLIPSTSILTGATAIAGNKIGDFLLLKLNETPLSTLQPYYAGLGCPYQATSCSGA